MWLFLIEIVIFRTLMNMKHTILSFLVVISFQAVSGQELDFGKESVREAYSVGVNIGRGLVTQGIEDIDQTALLKGLSDAVAQKETSMTQDEMQTTLVALSRKIQDIQSKKRKKEAAENAKKGAEFLASNKKRPEVLTTNTGLQYEIIKSGAGASPKPTDKVSVHYKGTLIDGTEFDSSYKRNKPSAFPVNRVIKGWTEGLQLMSPGSKFKFYIPSDLAYGQNGSRSIPPNSALIFEVELLEVMASKPPTPPKPKVVTSDIIKVPSKEGLAKGEKIEIIKAEDVEKEIEKNKKNSKPE